MMHLAASQLLPQVSSVCFSVCLSRWYAHLVRSENPPILNISIQGYIFLQKIYCAIFFLTVLLQAKCTRIFSLFPHSGSSSVSRLHARHRRKKQRRHRLQPAMSRTSSISSITDSTMSLNIITVTLNMDTVNFLGISIVGQSSKGGDGGIYVGSIMKG